MIRRAARSTKNNDRPGKRNSCLGCNTDKDRSGEHIWDKLSGGIVENDRPGAQEPSGQLVTKRDTSVPANRHMSCVALTRIHMEHYLLICALCVSVCVCAVTPRRARLDNAHSGALPRPLNYFPVHLNLREVGTLVLCSP